MFEQQPENLRQKIQHLAQEAEDEGDPSGWFEPLYQEAAGDSNQVPWAKLAIHPFFQDWLSQNPISGSGKTALVIGCGLGDDAETLANLDFEVTAFDISPTAIAWCRRRFPESKVNYLVADLFALPSEWNGAFDFVFECRTIQALPLSVRARCIRAIAEAVSKQGKLLVITRIRDNAITEPQGPPWALSEAELTQILDAGLSEVSRRQYLEPEEDPILQACLAYTMS